MKLNKCVGGAGTAWAGEGLPSALGTQEWSEGPINPRSPGRSGKRRAGGAPREDSLGALSRKKLHSYLVNDAPSAWNEEVKGDSANPDVSGFFSQECKVEHRKLSAKRAEGGSLSEALKYLR